MTARRSWSELSPRTRRVILVAGTAEAVLKVAALADLRRRPANQIRGSKLTWAGFVTVVNSFGVAPLVYFRFGRRT
jgi:hypothetical protein